MNECHRLIALELIEHGDRDRGADEVSTRQHRTADLLRHLGRERLLHALHDLGLGLDEPAPPFARLLRRELDEHVDVGVLRRRARLPAA